MFLSDRDLSWAIEQGRLIVQPPPSLIDPTSIDLRLDAVAEAKVWDVQGFQAALAVSGIKAPELHLGSFKYGEFAGRYLVPPPAEETAGPTPASSSGASRSSSARSASSSGRRRRRSARPSTGPT